MHELMVAAATDPIAWFGGLLDGLFGWALQTVGSVDPVTRTAIAGIGMLLETSLLVGLVIPGDTIVIVSATAVHGPAEYVALVLAVIGGALCGETIGFALGRLIGPRVRISWVGRRIGEAQWARAERYVERRGGGAIFLSRFLPFLHSLVPVTAGMGTMRYRRFLAWTLPACAIWSVAYVSVGALAAGAFQALLDRLHYAGYAFVAIVVLFAAAMLLAKRLIARRERGHLDR